MRTQDEIVARIAEISAGEEDFFGFAREELADHLDAEHLAPLLKPGTDLSDLTFHELTDDATLAGAATYLGFAFGKAVDHRGISAGRSVQKLREFAWLLGRDDVVQAMDAAGYAQYGVPKLVVFAKAFDLPVPDQDDIRRMAAGEPCEPGCQMGCDA